MKISTNPKPAIIKTYLRFLHDICHFCSISRDLLKQIAVVCVISVSETKNYWLLICHSLCITCDAIEYDFANFFDLVLTITRTFRVSDTGLCKLTMVKIAKNGLYFANVWNGILALKQWMAGKLFCIHWKRQRLLPSCRLVLLIPFTCTWLPVTLWLMARRQHLKIMGSFFCILWQSIYQRVVNSTQVWKNICTAAGRLHF